MSMKYWPAGLIALAVTCAVSAPVFAQVPWVPRALERIEKAPGQGPWADPTNAGEVFVAPPLRWEYWCTCKCGDLYHRMDVPTPSCADLATSECVLDGRKHALEDCARRLTPKADRLLPPLTPAWR